MCPQFRGFPRKIEGSEDCLYLNVITPDLSSTANLAVMVFIHGGAFFEGSGTYYGSTGIAENLAQRAVVVVVIQYRLGVLGFMNSVPGHIAANLGLFDQIQALRWVRDEIAEFGGDPNRVTIFGESAGAGSVSILTFSPPAKGLFYAAIMESGTAFCPWAIDGNMNSYSNASRDTAIATECVSPEDWNNGELSDLKRCLQTLPMEALLTSAESVASTSILLSPFQASFLPWLPAIDGDLLPDWPRNLAAERTPNMPIMLGTNHDEAFLWTKLQLDIDNVTVPDFNSTSFRNTVASYCQPKIFGQFSSRVTEALLDAYSSNRLPPDAYLEWLEMSTRFRSGRDFFGCTAEEAASLTDISNSKVYLYSFEYLPKSYPWPTYNGSSVNGTFHSVDLNFVFQVEDWNFSISDFGMANIMGQLWTNFAKTGNPNSPEALNVNWEEFQRNGPYLSLGLSPKMRAIYEDTANREWNIIVPEITHSYGPTFAPLTTPKYDPCASNPCHNNATCSSANNGFKCVCSANFMGTLCEVEACFLRVENNGVYVLEITNSAEEHRFLTYGQAALVRSGFSQNFRLNAVFGRSASCSLLPEMCPHANADPYSIRCYGTTLINFHCTGCSSP